MTEVLFYITEQAGTGVRDALAWRIAEKAWRQGRQIYVHCQDEAHARELDQQFWAQPASGFLPHALLGESPAPMVLGFGDDPGGHHDVLINLAAAVPDFVTRFERAAEMITGDPQQREGGRERFRFYRERGFPLKTHNL
ncbi:DNA polymerase III subunit chi [Alcanivorax balearicus MACL04]|uniref:DNA polymerase III subunit chi n=1 Tax=Alloalcanivorax balearicus MACL04 TaxID=1177182 RepID=A0ABT2QWX9_9GAMM|nr:DNA polymerase III subunit chi [Alloalcanivorax balearicus]MCU5782029.1 DNA polymerase III subunit chi [Alloalcanivorax balearicus MACL04]